MVLASIVLLALPGALAYDWRNVEIVGGGFVTGIVPHPTARDLVYARTDIGGAYRLDPRSQRWIPLTDWITRPDWNLYGVESLAVDPSDPSRLYIAAGTYTNEWGGLGAMLVSRDQGRTFRRVNLPFKNGGNMPGRSVGERLAVDPLDSRVVYFGTRTAGLWRSFDAGASWRAAARFPEETQSQGVGVGWVLFDPSEGRLGSRTRTIYTGVEAPGGPIYRSRDAGKTWTRVSGGPSRLMPLQAKLARDGSLVVAYGDQAGPNGVTDGAVWKLDARRGAWRDITPEPPAPGDTFGYAGVAVDARNPRVYMVSTLDRWGKGDTIFRTTDGGETWRSLKELAVMDSSKAPYLRWGRPAAAFGHWIGDVEIDPFRPGRAWYVTGATIWGTDELAKADRGRPVRWTVRAEGLEETAVLDLVSPPVGAAVVSALGDIGGFRHDELRRSPPSGMFSNPILNNTDDIDFAGRSPKTFVRVGRGGGRAHGAISVDGATTWRPFSSDPPGCRGGGSVAVGADGGSIVWTPDGAAPSVSTDGGRSWRGAVGAPPGRVISDRVRAGRFYIFGSNGTVAVSVDGGASFVGAATGLPKAPLKVGMPIAVLGRPGDLWLPTELGVFRSVDGARTFRRLAGVESADAVGFGKAARPADYPATYLIGTIGAVVGVFRSTDEGKSWMRINDARSGFGTMGTIEGDPKRFGRVYVGTNGRGVLVADPRGDRS